MRSTIICIDDEKILREMLYEQLYSWFGKNYNIEKASNGEEALQLVDTCLKRGRNISIVISDYIMPNMKGDELLIRINEMDPRIKKIMLTGYTSIEGIINTINKAALYRYITKPWDKKDLLLTLLEAIKSYEREQMSRELEKQYQKLLSEHKKTIDNIQKNMNTTIETMSRACDIRSLNSAGHSQRVAQYASFICKKMGISDDEANIINQACYLHDIGKLGFSDAEIEQLRNDKINQVSSSKLRKKQIEYAEKILCKLSNYDEIMEIIKYQFEEYCGSGLFRIKGDEIPFGSRIITIVNQFDFYKEKIENKPSLNDIVNMLIDSSGTIFDGDIVNVFVDIVRPQLKDYS